MKEPILEACGVKKHFKRSTQQPLLVLDDVNITIYEGEIVAVLGKSGSGKSTLLRILSGLIPASQGEVYYRKKLVTEPVKGVAMVFQNFALLPWLTVLENVELGLEALCLPRKERRKKALAMIDRVGLDGFESAYPKELSGGMCQRVGLARALVVEPDVLLMDEPFSALDVLTAENLRSDLLDIWQSQQLQTQAVLLVTHNIEEAVCMADRIVIFDSDPGTVKTILPVALAHPRSEEDPAFIQLVDDVYAAMTRKDAARMTMPLLESEALSYRLPDADISEATGLLEEIAHHKTSPMSLQCLADSVHLDVDDLFTLTEVLSLLNFATVSDGGISLTPEGLAFADADILCRKQLFAKHLLYNVPLARFIRVALDQIPDHCMPKEYFVEKVVHHLSEKEARRVLRVVIDWGRYAEVFAYDDNTGLLSLENPGDEP